MKSSNNRYPLSNALRNTAAVTVGILATALSGPTVKANASTQKSPSRSALTRVIKRLERGGEANVVSKKIELAGRTGIVSGRPIEFGVNGIAYLAFSEGGKPDFEESAAKTAASMTIVEEQSQGDTGPSIVKAGLNPDHVLVDERSGAPVGYAVAPKT